MKVLPPINPESVRKQDDYVVVRTTLEPNVLIMVESWNDEAKAYRAARVLESQDPRVSYSVIRNS